MNIKSIELLNYKNTFSLSDYKKNSFSNQVRFYGKNDTLEITSPNLLSTDAVTLQKAIPAETKKIIFPFLKAAKENGNQIFIYGGFVRDLLTGSKYNDIDFSIAGNTSSFFKKFLDNNKSSSIKYTTRGYNRPDMQNYQKIKLEFNGYNFDINPLGMWQDNTSTMEEILYKRAKACDFTISSMMLKPFFDKDGKMQFEFIDPLNAYQDTKNRILKLADNNGKLFEENAERVIQAIRLQKKYHLTYDSKLTEEIEKYLNHPTAIKDEMYYFRLKRGLKGLLKDNNNSILITTKDIIKNKLYRLF